MKLKSFFLGTTTVLALAAPAAAADLSIAEQVDYVRVCDAFGTGYWYIPGSDTCIKIGGYVRFDARVTDGYYTASSHSAHWDFRTRARLNMWANSQTDLGQLTGFVRLQGTYDNTSSGDGNVLYDRAWLSFGPLLAGKDQSLYDYSGGYTLDAGGYRSDEATDQIRWTQKFDTVSLALSLEDPRDRHGALPAGYGAQAPDVIGALTFSEGPFDAKVSGAFIDKWSGKAGYAVQLGTSVKLDSIAKGDAIRLVAAYAQDAGSFTGALKTLGNSYAGGTSWNVVGSAVHYWTPQFSTAVTGSYVTATNGSSRNAWQAAVSAAWVPVKGITFGGELNYVNKSWSASQVTGLGRIIREF